MTYIKIGDLEWDTLPGGSSLYSNVQLFDEHSTAENPADPENPLVGPATVEYCLADGEVTVTLSPATPMTV